METLKKALSNGRSLFSKILISIAATANENFSIKMDVLTLKLDIAALFFN